MYNHVSKSHREFLGDLITTHITDDLYCAAIAGKYKLYEKTTGPRLNFDIDLATDLSRYVGCCPTVVISIILFACFGLGLSRKTEDSLSLWFRIAVIRKITLPSRSLPLGKTCAFFGTF